MLLTFAISFGHVFFFQRERCDRGIKRRLMIAKVTKVCIIKHYLQYITLTWLISSLFIEKKIFHRFIRKKTYGSYLWTEFTCTKEPLREYRLLFCFQGVEKGHNGNEWVNAVWRQRSTLSSWLTLPKREQAPKLKTNKNQNKILDYLQNEEGPLLEKHVLDRYIGAQDEIFYRRTQRGLKKRASIYCRDLYCTSALGFVFLGCAICYTNYTAGYSQVLRADEALFSLGWQSSRDGVSIKNTGGCVT